MRRRLPAAQITLQVMVFCECASAALAIRKLSSSCVCALRVLFMFSCWRSCKSRLHFFLIVSSVVACGDRTHDPVLLMALCKAVSTVQ